MLDVHLPILTACNNHRFWHAKVMLPVPPPLLSTDINAAPGENHTCFCHRTWVVPSLSCYRMLTVIICTTYVGNVGERSCASCTYGGKYSQTLGLCRALIACTIKSNKFATLPGYVMSSKRILLQHLSALLFYDVEKTTTDPALACYSCYIAVTIVLSNQLSHGLC
jgi:hypothetical protein